VQLPMKQLPNDTTDGRVSLRRGLQRDYLAEWYGLKKAIN